MARILETKDGGGVAQIGSVGSSWSGGDTISGVANTYGPDRQNDRVVPGAFEQSIANDRWVPILWQHIVTEPLGRSLTLREDQRLGLCFRGALSSTLRSGDAWALIRDHVLEMSIGYTVSKSRYVQEPGWDGKVTRIRLLEEIDLAEISCVTWGASMNTNVGVGSEIGKSRDVDVFGLVDDILILAELDAMPDGLAGLDSKAALQALGAQKREVERKIHAGLTDQEYTAKIRAEVKALLGELGRLAPVAKIPTIEEIRATQAELARLATL